MALALAAVVGGDKQDCPFPTCRLRGAQRWFSPMSLSGHCHRGVILRRAVAGLVPGVIHVIQMDECERGFVVLPKCGGLPDGVGGAVGVLDDIDGPAFEEPAETIPIVEDPNDRLCLLAAAKPENGREIPPEPLAMGAMWNLSGCQSFEVTPCCSGPAPMIIEAQLGCWTWDDAAGVKVHAPCSRRRLRLAPRRGGCRPD